MLSQPLGNFSVPDQTPAVTFYINFVSSEKFGLSAQTMTIHMYN